MRTRSRWLRLTGLLVSAAALGQPPPDVVKDAKAFEDATLLALAAEQSQRQGPGEVMTWFLEAAHAGDFAAASAALSLEHVPEAQRASEGPRLARRLMFLLDQQLTLEPEALARQDPTASLVVVGELPLRRFQVPVELVRAPAGAEPPWQLQRPHRPLDRRALRRARLARVGAAAAGPGEPVVLGAGGVAVAGLPAPAGAGLGGGAARHRGAHRRCSCDWPA